MEWFYYNRKDVATKGCLALFIIPVAILVVILLCMQGVKPLKPAPEVKLDQNEVCIDLRSSILYDELIKHDASEYFQISKPAPIFGGSFDITCKETEIARQKFDAIFLTDDSIAYHMSKEYPHVFQFDEKKKKISLDSHSAGKFTTVPAWLIIRLAEEGFLILPE